MVQTIEALKAEIKDLYRSNSTPWTVGWSGGKDFHSDPPAGLVRSPRAGPERAHFKPVYVITTDTLVENPVIAAYVGAALKKMNAAAKEQGLPIEAHRLTPRSKTRSFPCS